MLDGVLLFSFFVLLMGGVVKGVIAMGLPTFGIGMLSLVMSPAHAAAILIIPSAATNVWQLRSGPNLAGVSRRFAGMMVLLAAGVLIGGFGLGGLHSRQAPIALGAILLAYGGVGLTAMRFCVPPGAERWMSPLAGLLTGIVTGTTGVSVMPLAPYLQALELEREDLVQALGLGFTVSTFALAVTLTGTDAPFADPRALIASLAALVPAFLGMEAGRRVREKISPAAFRRCFFAGLALLGAYMVVRGLL